ncbi:SDR family oxidoreductase [Streptomyces sp. NK08204]|uniref:SDR family NAD(P)-dependent oxidoreductase n=1 Tax=Streptomyces sp. NK08204 TaxID=2873260 RepID=UPI0027E3A70C|nr:SDR family oxidoreductase [Streptomyces sp. NK08204]
MTDGGTGIGKAAAAFAACGDRVFITGRRAEVLQRTAKEPGSQVTALPCDITDVEQLQAIAGQFPGELHVLVNNAGVNRGLGATPPRGLRALADSRRADMESNLMGAVLTTAAVGGLLVRGAAIVDINSFAADRGAGSHGTAKAAMSSWNTALARQLGPRGITCNVVAPGCIEDTEFLGGTRTEGFRKVRLEETLVGRVGHSEDIAQTVRFLASPEARYITGQVLRVDGGVIPTR